MILVSDSVCLLREMCSCLLLFLCLSAYQQPHQQMAYVQQPHQQTAYVQQPQTVLVQQQHQKKKGGMGLGKMAAGQFCFLRGGATRKKCFDHFSAHSFHCIIIMISVKNDGEKQNTFVPRFVSMKLAAILDFGRSRYITLKLLQCSSNAVKICKYI